MILYCIKFLLLLLFNVATAASAFVAPSSNIIAAKVLPKTHHGIISRATAAKLNASNIAGANSVRNLAVAGRIPWKKLLVTRSQWLRIASIMRAETHVMDVVIVAVLSAFPNRIGEFLYTRFLHRFGEGAAYEDSYTRHALTAVGSVARIAAVCYFVDTLEVVFEVAGLKHPKWDVSTLIAKVLYSTWACLKVRQYKRGFFEAIFDHTPEQMSKGRRGNVGIWDKISDFFLFGVLSAVWIDILKIKVGKGLSSIFALGGAGTFVITLASQDLAKRVLNGLSLAGSDAFYVGDSIMLGDGTSGIVRKMGWLSTEIQGFDELVTTIPNTQLSDVRISNKSRMKFSRVKQNLHFRYLDLDKIPGLVDEIKGEIAKSCPKVVTDGSHTFRVRFVDYAADHVVVLVDCRLRNPPSGEKYYEARQGVLEAIARAVKRKGVQFSLPTEISLES